MDKEIVDWVIELEGRPHDLEHCVTLFESGREIRVQREQSADSMARYYLHSSVFKGLPATQIHTVAAKLIDVMHAAANSARGGSVTMRGLPITVRAEGSRVPMRTVSSDTGILSDHLLTVSSDTGILSDQLSRNIIKSNFAPDWFDDARNEVTKAISDPIAASAARRREIIFAVCTLESYIFEWTRDILLGNYAEEAEWRNKLNKYFPGISNNPITENWKDVPKDLYRLGLIKGTPDLGGQPWQTFREKVYKYRNALIHAAVSWPKLEVSASPAPARDYWKAELGALSAGWAIEIVAELIRELNNKAGTATPDWLDPSTQTPA
jgi:hypothetical protein